MYRLILGQGHTYWFTAKSITLNSSECAFLPPEPLNEACRSILKGLGGTKRGSKWWRVPSSQVHNITLIP